MSPYRRTFAIAFLVTLTIGATISVVSEDHRNAVIASECVRSGQQWVGGDCVRTGASK